MRYLPQLVKVDAFYPSTYNPRITDPHRLDLIELSLRKLGFLLPLYVDKSGETLSGHQRHLVAQRLGVLRVPVVYLKKKLSLDERQAINIVFNRATNDMDMSTTPKALAEAMATLNIHELAAVLPDKTPDTGEFYPCMAPVTLDIAPLLAVNRGRWLSYARNMARRLDTKGVRMPLVLTEGGRVINGIGRLEHLAEQGETQVEAVLLTPAEAAFAEAMLNLLSMDFDLERRYADPLRHNSFRRAQTGGASDLGYGFTMFVFPNRPASAFRLASAKHRLAFERKHGTTLLDFGAGRLKETTALRACGFDVTPFEPFYCPPGGNDIDPDASRALTCTFLDEVARGKQWHTLFLSAILNSVPFYEDRTHIICLLAALAGDGLVCASANSIHSPNWTNATAPATAHMLSKGYDRDIRFVADYEPGVTISGDSRYPKAQKFHTKREFWDLFTAAFEQVRVGLYQRNVVWAVARNPRPLDPVRLRAAIAFEFDLPYPDGSRMGLVDEALAAFSQRLGLSL